MIAQHPKDHLDDVLAKRGIAQAAQDAGWLPMQQHGQWGWMIPLYRTNGQVLEVKRWKNGNSEGDPKCIWIGDSKQAKYYVLPGLLKAIQDKGGICYLASGEPDVLAYHAAGIRNVFSWFGENSIPSSLVEDLKLMGITRLLDFPDRDSTGLTKTAKLVTLLQNSGIEYVPCKLPGEVVAKHGNDINWLWINGGFNRDRFQIDLLDCHQYQESELAPYQPYKIAQANTQAKEKPLTPAQEDAIKTVGYARFIDALKKHINAMQEVKSFDAEGWSKPFRCLFHDDHNPSACVNNQTGSYKCFASCGSLSAEEFGDRVGISLSRFKDEVREEFVKSQTSQPANIVAMPKTSVPISIGETYTSSEDAILDVEGYLLGTKVPNYEPLEHIYTSFHRFGGFAHWQTPGKLSYYLGISGGGKTAVVEYINEVLLQRGHDTIIFSPEWTAQETYQHSIQRAGGMDHDEIEEFKIWRLDEKNGVAPAKRRGRAPSQERLNHTLQIMAGMKTWTGQAYHLNANIATSNLNQIVDTIEKLVEDKRAAGRKVTNLFIDYLQRLPKGAGDSWDRLEMVSNVVKGICERQLLFGHIVIQPKKHDGKAARDGEALDHSGGQGISDQQANLFTTFTPKFDPDTGEKLPYVEVNMVKNSNGRTGKLLLRAAWAQRMICDVEHIIEQPRREMVYEDDTRAPF